MTTPEMDNSQEKWDALFANEARELEIMTGILEKGNPSFLKDSTNAKELLQSHVDSTDIDTATIEIIEKAADKYIKDINELQKKSPAPKMSRTDLMQDLCEELQKIGVSRIIAEFNARYVAPLLEKFAEAMGFESRSLRAVINFKNDPEGLTRKGTIGMFMPSGSNILLNTDRINIKEDFYANTVPIHEMTHALHYRLIMFVIWNLDNTGQAKKLLNMLGQSAQKTQRDWTQWESWIKPLPPEDLKPDNPPPGWGQNKNLVYHFSLPRERLAHLTVLHIQKLTGNL